MTSPALDPGLEPAPELSERPVDALPELAPGETDYGGAMGYVTRGRSLRMNLPFGAWLPARGTLMMVGLALAALWVVTRWVHEVPLESNDPGLALQAGDVALMTGGFEVLPGAETLVRTKALLGTERLEYTYAKTAADQPELRWVVERRPSEAGARDSYAWTNVQIMADWKLGGEDEVGLIELDQGCSWGDERGAYLVQVNGQPVGNSFAARRGDVCVYLELRGVWIEDPWAFGRLLEPVLARIAAR